MIENFCIITEDGITIEPKLGAGADKFEGVDEIKMQAFFRGQGKGISWKVGKEFVQIFETGKKIEGLPTPDLESVIVVYPHDHFVYAAPSNSVIYEAYGKQKIQLRVPTLVSPAAAQRRARVSYNIEADAYFRGIYWDRLNDGVIAPIMSIDFDWEWWESRVIDPQTGEFGKCVAFGKR